MPSTTKEIRIPVPWGYIAGVWWGSENVKPLLCLHGYHDNAGTWNTLIPLLPPDMSFLAIDFPGHGYSSNIPTGVTYNLVDFVLIIRRIVKWYNWDKISLLSHSFGATVAFIYSALYPENVENYIALDGIKPFSLDHKNKAMEIKKSIEYFLKFDSLDPNGAPSYTYEQIVDHLYKAIQHWASREACEILLKRGSVKLTDGRYAFRRDPRLKAFADVGFTHDFDMLLATKVRCNMLIILANQGFIYETPEIREKFLNIVKDSVAYYEYHRVDGKHHMHLDFPEKIAPLISDFLKKMNLKCSL